MYVASGAKYIRAAMRSADSVRRHCPDLPIHLFADWERHGFAFGADAAPFTSVASIDNPHRRSKVDHLARSPFARTLYLDTDTVVKGDVRPVFELLDRFDMALAHAHRRARPSVQWQTAVPAAYPQFNAGVILFRNTPAVSALLEDWSRAYAMAGFAEDQPTLRELLWLSDLRVATLPPEYNVRFLKHHLLWYPDEATTRILHHARYHDGPLWLLRRWVRLAKRAGRRLVQASPHPLPSDKR